MIDVLHICFNIFIFFVAIYLTQAVMIVPVTLLSGKRKSFLLFSLSALITSSALLWALWMQNHEVWSGQRIILIIDAFYALYIFVYIKAILAYTTKKLDWFTRAIQYYFFFHFIFSMANESMERIVGWNLMWNENIPHTGEGLVGILMQGVGSPTLINDTLLIIDTILFAAFLILYIRGYYGSRDKYVSFGMFFTLLAIAYITVTIATDSPYYFPLVQCSIFIEIFRLCYVTMQEATIENFITKKELQLANRKLRQKSAFAKVGENTAEFVHDVGNELMVFAGNFFLVQDHITKSHQCDLDSNRLRRAQASLDRMSEMFSDFKAELSERSKEIDASSNTLKDIFNVLSDVFLNECLDKGIHLQAYLDREAEDIRLPNTPMMRVLSNLVRNSIQAVEGTNTPWIKVKAVFTPTHLVMSVTDSGKGIPEDIADKIMDPMFSTKKSQGGTGLGLASCQRIIRELGGELHLDKSSSNTRFEMRLPYSHFVVLPDHKVINGFEPPPAFGDQPQL